MTHTPPHDVGAGPARKPLFDKEPPEKSMFYAKQAVCTLVPQEYCAKQYRKFLLRGKKVVFFFFLLLLRGSWRYFGIFNFNFQNNVMELKSLPVYCTIQYSINILRFEFNPSRFCLRTKHCVK